MNMSTRGPLGLFMDCRVLDNDFPHNNTNISPMKSKSCIRRWNTFKVNDERTVQSNPKYNSEK